MKKSLLGKVNDFLNMEIPVPFKAKGKDEDALLDAIQHNTQNSDSIENEPVEITLENTDAANEVMDTVEDEEIHELEGDISHETEEDIFNITESSNEASSDWGDTSWGDSSWGAGDGVEEGASLQSDDSGFSMNNSNGNSEWAGDSDLNSDTEIHHNEGGNDYDMDIPEEELKVQELLANNVLVEMEKEIREFAEFELDPIVFERYAELEYKRYQPKSYFLIPVEY